MIVSVIKAALSSIHGTKIIEEQVSSYYLADEISGTYRGMMIAIDAEKWVIFRQLTQVELVQLLRKLARNVKLSAFRKHPRGPKKPAAKRKSDPKKPHVSTAKLIAIRKKQKYYLEKAGDFTQRCEDADLDCHDRLSSFGDSKRKIST
jgi:hypothetical protein